MELRVLFITAKVVKSILYLNHEIQWKMKFRVKSLVWAQWKGNFLRHVNFLLMVKSPKSVKSVLDEAYFSRFFWLFTMSKKIIFCKKYFLQNIHFLLMVKSQRCEKYYLIKHTFHTFSWLFTMSKKWTCCKKYFLQNINFLLMVKSQNRCEKYAWSSTLFTLFLAFYHE